LEDSLHTLAYLSQIARDENGTDLKAIVADILAVARRNNAAVGVTGALLCSSGWFAQVLEGSQYAVESIFEAIQMDKRHRDITVLFFRPLENRHFGSWSMALAGLSDAAVGPLNFDGLLADPRGIDTGKFGRDIVKILTDLISRQEVAGTVDRCPIVAVRVCC
jgi:hypothetical protein